MFAFPSLLLAALIISTEVVEQPIEQTHSQTAMQNQVSSAPQETPNSTTEAGENNAVTAMQGTALEKTTQPITITNAIEPSMLTYKHWTGTYSPEIFTVTINDTQVASGETCTLESSETPLVVQFEYSFMNGIRKGSKKISYQMNKECTDAKITFSWLDTWQVIIDNATPLKAEVLS